MTSGNHLKSLTKSALSILPAVLRHPPSYWGMRWFLGKAQHWDSKTIRKWQLGKLQDMVRYAFDTVPGYNMLYREAGFEPRDLTSLEALRHIPFVTKELLRDNLKDFTSRAVPKSRLRYITTGGSPASRLASISSPRTPISSVRSSTRAGSGRGGA